MASKRVRRYSVVSWRISQPIVVPYRRTRLSWASYRPSTLPSVMLPAQSPCEPRGKPHAISRGCCGARREMAEGLPLEGKEMWWKPPRGIRQDWGMWRRLR
jgi:hypothetical protein